ncbi:MAG: sugar transporter superfamily protein [Thermoleophilia bacterium]|nr:sugar transporter superfamily protein [Thermoleophilia bacterium]
MRMAWLIGRTALEERLATDSPAPTRRHVARAALLVFGLMLLLEPAIETLRLGQVNFFLGWLIAEDVLGRGRPWRGVGIGIAAAIKLTPASFLVLLAVTRRVRVAIVGVAAFVVAGAIGFIALPQESRAFWSGTGFDADRTGGVEYISNQSINGMVWRLLGPGGSTAWWVVLSALCAAVGIWAARRAWQRGARNIAFGLTGLVSCLVSPVSWTHHWVLVLPLLIGLWSAPRFVWLARAVVAGSFALLGSRLLWHMPNNDGVEFHQSGLDALAGNSYVLLGFVLLAITAAAFARRA